jgi:hypothetical protein
MTCAGVMSDRITPKSVRAFEGVADPAFFVAEIEQPQEIARAARLGSLEYPPGSGWSGRQRPRPSGWSARKATSTAILF